MLLLLLRVVIVLAVSGLVLGVVVYLVTGRRDLLRYVWRFAKYALYFVLLLFLLLAAERLSLIILPGAG